MIFQEAAADVIPSAVKLEWMAPISHLPGCLGVGPHEGQADSQPFPASHSGGVQRDTKPSLHQALVSLLGHFFLAFGQEGERSARLSSHMVSGPQDWLPHHLSG